MKQKTKNESSSSFSKGRNAVIHGLSGRHTAELILSSLKGKDSFTHKMRYVSIGAVIGDHSIIRFRFGNWTKDEMKQLFSEILLEMFQLAADNKLKVETIGVTLEDIEQLSEMEVPQGKGLVVII